MAEIKLDAAALAELEGIIRAAALTTVQALHGEVVTAAVMPFDVGHMQNDQTGAEQIVDGGEIHTMLTTDAPQARRLYYHPEYNFQTVNNANAGAAWWADWLPGGDQENFVPDTFAAQLERRLSK